MKSILLASNFLIVGHVLQNLCEIVTRSGKELKFVENKTVGDYFETTHLSHLRLFQNFTGSLSKKTFVTYSTSKQKLPNWFDSDDFHCYHSREVVETCLLPS